jgi:hypothetical protein
MPPHKPKRIPARTSSTLIGMPTNGKIRKAGINQAGESFFP